MKKARDAVNPTRATLETVEEAIALVGAGVGEEELVELLLARVRATARMRTNNKAKAFIFPVLILIKFVNLKKKGRTF